MIAWGLAVIATLLTEREARYTDALGQALWRWQMRACGAWMAYYLRNDVAGAQRVFDETTDELQKDVQLALDLATRPPLAHNWLGRCLKCGSAHSDLNEVVHLNEVAS